MGIETGRPSWHPISPMLGLNGLGSPMGIETLCAPVVACQQDAGLNGLGSPMGIETANEISTAKPDDKG